MANVLTSLRDLVPIRPLTIVEALRIAELQATKLLELQGVTEPPVPEEIITELPRVQGGAHHRPRTVRSRAVVARPLADRAQRQRAPHPAAVLPGA